MKEIFKTDPVFGRVLHGYGTPEEPLCIAADVAAWINHSNTGMMVSNIDDDEKLLSTIARGGQNRSVTMITERGLYKVLYSSRKPTARIFQEEIQRTFATLRQNGKMTTTAVAVVGPQIFQYQGSEITFKLADGSVMTNATEMANLAAARLPLGVSTDRGTCWQDFLILQGLLKMRPERPKPVSAI